MRITVVVILVFFAFFRCTAQVPPDQPNILFIVVDDLNDFTGDLGGSPEVLTPNISRISANGTVFTNAQCNNSLCCPSRTSFLTGKDAA